MTNLLSQISKFVNNLVASFRYASMSKTIQAVAKHELKATRSHVHNYFAMVLPRYPFPEAESSEQVTYYAISLNGLVRFVIVNSLLRCNFRVRLRNENRIEPAIGQHKKDCSMQAVAVYKCCSYYKNSSNLQ
jgi:hypothetical protein